ncbi:putative metal-dependent hydrolase YjjV [bioreactor metagenome]|uniref:Putative metal-dependent hydrolase YjjV n=1 Tax=bioreactor metagenome TaxID=1076179 RepID=A0A645C2S2_9ZZZZ|nr:TatD family hydrolase [Paludibacter sp.]
MIDTHAHIYSEEFDNDRANVIQRAMDAGVKKIILPAIDSSSFSRMLELENDYPGFCYATIGLHPTSVNASYISELNLVRSELKRRPYLAIGEIGIDLYWDKTYLNEQLVVFQHQLDMALHYNIPVIIHVRDSFDETMKALLQYKNKGLKGIFHSFTGTLEQAESIIDFGGFLLGINGIITFKNSGLSNVIKNIGLKHLVLETDAPYLTPAPFRGKRNESAYLEYIVEKLSTTLSVSPETIIQLTTENALNLFKLQLEN